MTACPRSLAILLAILSAAAFSACKHHYKGYYWDHWKPRFSSHSQSSGNVQNTANYSRPSYQPDPFYAQQQAAREANMRAVQQQQYKNDMYNYQRGYTNKLPGIP
jgi:uncharacterized protein involved in type VI secretion and phage assembly